MSAVSSSLVAARAMAGCRATSTSNVRLSAVFVGAPVRGRNLHSKACARASLRVFAADVDPYSLAVLQQKLGGQRIQLEGSGAQQMQKQMGLVDKTGRSLADGKKIVKTDTNQEEALELTFDPENLLGDVDATSASMLIDRRLAARDADLAKQAEEELKKEYEKQRAELEEARAARVQPEDPEELVKYFFDTEINEMEFEIVRCRPQLTDAFFAYLRGAIDGEADETEKEKMEALFQVTSEFVGFVDSTAKSLAAPADRLKKLLMSPDKRQCILDMVADEEIDMNLLALLQTNINTARAQGNDDAVTFMTKIYNACAKFVDVPSVV